MFWQGEESWFLITQQNSPATLLNNNVFYNKNKKFATCAVVLSGDHPAGEITGVLRRLSMLVTSCCHAAVLSVSAGIPIAAVSMDERLDNLLRELSLDRDYLHSMKEPDLGEKLCSSMELAWELIAYLRKWSAFLGDSQQTYTEVVVDPKALAKRITRKIKQA